MRFRFCMIVVAAATLGGCVGDNKDVTIGSLGTDPLTPAVPAAASSAPVSFGPLLEGALGAKLTEADRQSAFLAETEAVSSGDRKTWRGSKGVYGFVVPGASSLGGGDCRTFTHTIYFAGRPQSGTGKGCREPDGNWKITG